MQHKGLLLIAALSCVTAFAADPTVDEIIDRLQQSVGGIEKAKQIHSLRTVSRLAVPGIEGEARVVSTMKPPQMVYTVVTRGDSTFVEAFDGTTKWAMVNGGPAKKMPDEDARAYADDTWVMVDGPLVNYKEKGHHIEYQGEEIIDHTPTYKLFVTMKSGDTSTYYLDKTTCLPVKQIGVSKRNGVETTTIGFNKDYKTIQGFTMATTLYIKVGNAPPVRLKIENIEFNFPLDESIFKMPL